MGQRWGIVGASSAISVVCFVLSMSACGSDDRPSADGGAGSGVAAIGGGGGFSGSFAGSGAAGTTNSTAGASGASGSTAGASGSAAGSGAGGSSAANCPTAQPMNMDMCTGLGGASCEYGDTMCRCSTMRMTWRCFGAPVNDADGGMAESQCPDTMPANMSACTEAMGMGGQRQRCTYGAERCTCRNGMWGCVMAGGGFPGGGNAGTGAAGTAANP